jgi:16S rRNA (guanine966-N2)-methyltransferase
MRIVAGSARGRALLGPKGEGIRPTADRVRETVFNVLGQWLEGVRVLDLYAGTGALSLEALSRGALGAVMVDTDREAVSLCRRNAEALGFAQVVEILCLPALRAVVQLGARGERFELVFADPPYAARAAKDVLESVERAGVLVPGGTVCLEHDRREEVPERAGALARVDQRRFGDTAVSLFRFA